jgi:nicotinamidase-related amidase
MNDYITPDREHSALLIIDVQRDFTLMDATAEIPGTLQAVQYIQHLVQVYRKQDYPIIHIIRSYYHADGSNVNV